MIRKIDYSEVKDSFMATYGRTNFITANKPRIGICPIGIWLGYAHPEFIVNGKDNTISPVGVLRWEWIKRIDISDISKDTYGFIVFVLHDFDAVWETIPSTNKLAIKTACTRLGNEGRVLAYPAHIAFDFNADDYSSFIEVIRQNNFAELRMIGHIDDSYKLSKGQTFWSYAFIVIMVIALTIMAISILSSIIGF